mmetsp:Transcript_359/g.960  ORF Transcript_359/g.960 Transcript_359/m.960 type:complete len:115 (+) Transcript_359:1-345(+)
MPGAFEGATVIYMLSNAFSASTFAQFLESVAGMPAAAQHRLREVVTSRAIPPDLLARFNGRSARAVSSAAATTVELPVPCVTITPRERTVWVPTSWSPTVALTRYAVLPRVDMR